MALPEDVAALGIADVSKVAVPQRARNPFTIDDLRRSQLQLAP
jgi:hypothetical protein